MLNRRDLLSHSLKVSALLAGAGLPADAPSFLLVPARIDALAAAARWLTAPAVPEVAPLPGAPAILPALLAQAPGRWLSREAPPAAEVTALVDALRDYLGPTAYTWLVASAAYPQLSADLTAYLAHRLAEQPGLPPERPDPRLFEARLMAIAQLPWCRQGWMPDWLRRALLLSQPVGSRILIKSIVQGLFKTAGNEAMPGGIALGNVARDDRSNWLRRLRDRIGFAGVVEGEPADSPLRDVIYLGVLRGDYDRELTLEVGGTLDDSDLAPLTLNPLRWLWAGAMVVAHPARRVVARLQRPGPPAAPAAQLDGARPRRQRRERGEDPAVLLAVRRQEGQRVQARVGRTHRRRVRVPRDPVLPRVRRLRPEGRRRKGRGARHDRLRPCRAACSAQSRAARFPRTAFARPTT